MYKSIKPQLLSLKNIVNLTVWLLLISLVSLLVSAPTSIKVQAILGVATVIIVLFLKPYAAENIAVRFAMMATASTLVMRYWAWRLTETLPPMDDLISFCLAMLLFLVETYTIGIFFLSGFLTSDPVRRKPPPLVLANDLPTVDVLVPSYNEPLEMLSITLAAAKSMHYPPQKLNVVLCDDGGTDQRCNHDDISIAAAARKRRSDLVELCAELGVMYSTRAKNEQAKAGNLSSALHKVSGELVVVLDADHVPARDFLEWTVGYFVQEPELFLVQTPHFFINPDPIDRNVGFRDDCPPENEMFYHLTLQGSNRWGGAFFCGSAAVLRRRALDEAGGFAGETIVEDAETALQMHRNGWKSTYVDRTLIAGVQPETFQSFIQQRGRWATGMLQLLILKNPLSGKGLSLAQRICYFSSMVYWLFPIARMTFILSPLAYLLFGLQIFVATIEEVSVYVISYIVVNLMVQNALYARVRWPLISEVYETAQAPYLTSVLFRTIRNPRSAKFNVTAKEEVILQHTISHIYKPLLITFVLTLIGVAAAVVRWIMLPSEQDIILVVGGWAVYNFIIVGASLRAVWEKQQRRGMPRIPLSVDATVALKSSASLVHNATVVDASISGCMIFLPHHYGSDQERIGLPVKGEIFFFTPKFPDAPHLQSAVKAQVVNVIDASDGILLGCRYDPSQPMVARISVANMIFGDSSRWAEIRAMRNKKMGLLRGAFHVAAVSCLSMSMLMRSFFSETISRFGGKDLPHSELSPAKSTGEQVHWLAFGERFDPEPTLGPVELLKEAMAGLDLAKEQKSSERKVLDITPDNDGGLA